MSPNSGNGASQPTPGAKLEATQRDTSALMSERILVREAHKVAVDLGLNICGSRLKRLVRRYVRDGRADIDFRTWFITYRDLTGDTAVRNVLRGGGGPDA